MHLWSVWFTSPHHGNEHTTFIEEMSHVVLVALRLSRYVSIVLVGSMRLRQPPSVEVDFIKARTVSLFAVN